MSEHSIIMFHACSLSTPWVKEITCKHSLSRPCHGCGHRGSTTRPFRDESPNSTLALPPAAECWHQLWGASSDSKTRT